MTYIKPSKANLERYCFDRVEKLCQEYKSNHHHHSFEDQYFLHGKGGTVVIEIYPHTSDFDYAGHILICKGRNQSEKVIFSHTYRFYSGLLKGFDNYRIHKVLGGIG